MTCLWNPGKAEHTDTTSPLVLPPFLYSWTNHRLHHYNNFSPLCSKVFFYIIPEWPCFLETYSSFLLISYQHPSLRIAGFDLRGSHPQHQGHPVFMDYRSGCKGPFIQVNLHIWWSQFLLFYLGLFFASSFFLEGTKKKGICITGLETWNSAIELVSLLVGGIPHSKPEHFLSVVEHWNIQCCTVL